MSCAAAAGINNRNGKGPQTTQSPADATNNIPQTNKKQTSFGANQGKPWRFHPPSALNHSNWKAPYDRLTHSTGISRSVRVFSPVIRLVFSPMLPRRCIPDVTVPLVVSDL